jgi:hypothetical protein
MEPPLLADKMLLSTLVIDGFAHAPRKSKGRKARKDSFIVSESH